MIHVIRKNQLLKSTTYLLILNMACGDLVTTVITCPSLIKYLFFGLVWFPGKFGSVLCKLNLYLVLVCLLGCIFSLVGITVDRFLAVSRPLKHKPWSKWTKVVIPAIWITAIILPLPGWKETGIVHELSLADTALCLDGRAPLTMMVILGVCFLLPFTIMLVLYPIISYRLWTRQVPGELNVRQQQMANLLARKVTKMMVAVALCFFLCWSPQLFFIVLHPVAADLAAKMPYWLIPFVLWLEGLNGAMNPVLYAIFNESFRKGFKDIIFRSISRNHNVDIARCANNQCNRNPAQDIALVRFHNNLGFEK